MELWIAAAGLAVTVFGGAWKYWSTVRARPRFRMDFDWIQHAGSPILRFTVSNVGRSGGTIKEIRFGLPETPPTQGWLRQRAILDRLPLTLEPHSSAPAFYLETNPMNLQDFDQHLATGRIAKAFVEDLDGKIHAFGVPSLYPDA